VFKSISLGRIATLMSDWCLKFRDSIVFSSAGVGEAVTLSRNVVNYPVYEKEEYIDSLCQAMKL